MIESINYCRNEPVRGEADEINVKILEENEKTLIGINKRNVCLPFKSKS
jgi:hypothetical protein